MPRYRYRAVTKAGQMVVGEVEAASREEVAGRIEYLGHLLIEAEAAATSLLGAASWKGRPRARDITLFLQQLALLVDAGLTLETALLTLGEEASRSVAGFAGALRASISAGDSFAEALERHPSIIEPMYVAMIRAGEASGKLETVLRAVVDDRSRSESLTQRINSAVRYPLFLVGSAVGILLFFLTQVVPQFEPVFKDLGGRLNAGAGLVMATSEWLRGNFEMFLGACLAIALGAGLSLMKKPVRVRMIAALAAVPGLAGPMRDRRTARIIGVLGLLTGNGVPVPTTLKILRDIVSEPRLVAATDRVRDQVRNGRRLADALADVDLLPPLAVRMLRVGDETGDLPAIASHAAQFYEQRLAIGLDRLMAAVGPATIIVVSVIIGGLVISIMSALLSITELAL